MTDGADASCTNDVETHVSLLVNRRFAGVQPHPYADCLSGRPLCGRECALRVDRSCDGVPGAREGEEERVSLRVDFDAVVGRERIADDAPVRRQDIGILVAESL